MQITIRVVNCYNIDGATVSLPISYRFLFVVMYFLEYIPPFDVFSTVDHSIDLFHLPTLMHNSFIH